ncbi:MAG: hypothetical protein M3Z46_08060 [Actinomycetota bacterium]|nr:hypothetical protein [Actinomycetota bacterium]
MKPARPVAPSGVVVGGSIAQTGRRELRGVVAQRARFHLSYRLGVRAYLFATGRRRSQRVAAVIGAGVDAIIWDRLRRTGRLLFGRRLAADVIDVGASSLLVDEVLEPASLVGVPLAMEAGIRAGALGFAVPAAHLMAMTTARKRLGRPTSPTTFGWQVMGAVMGISLSWYERREHDAAVSSHAQELPAEREAAWLAGQNAVALGADTVVDELARLEYLIGAQRTRGSETGSGLALREWKAALASTTSSRAVYLGTMLSRWSRSRQSTALARDVQIDLVPGDGTTILSAHQAQVLVDELDRLGLSGDVEVRVLPKNTAALPGEPIALRVGPHEVRLPPDPGSSLRPFDPAPLVILAGGLWCLGLSSSNHGGAPRAMTVPAAAATLPLAWWSHRSVTGQQGGAAEWMVLRSIGHALVVALVVTPALSAPYDPAGAQVFPATMTLLSASVLAARYEHTFSAAAKRRVSIAAAGALALSLLPVSKPVRWADLAIAAVELGTVYVAFNRVQAELDRSADELARELAEQSDRARAEAYDDGHRLVVDLVVKAADRARDRLASTNDLGAAVAAQATERLRTIDEMLADLS